MIIEETEEDTNIRVSAIINKRLLEELALPLYDNKSQEEGFALLNSTSITSEITQLKPITLTGLLSNISMETKANICDWVHLLDFRNKVEQQDRIGIAMYIDILLSANKIKEEEATRIIGMLNDTETIVVTSDCVPRSFNIIRGIPGGPNVVSEAQFAEAWKSAGRE